MFIVFTVQPLVCCNKNDMEKVGQDSVSDISERSKGTVNFSYSISVKEFRARYQKLSVWKIVKRLNWRSPVQVNNSKIVSTWKMFIYIAKQYIYIGTKIAFKQLTQCI